MALLQSLFHLTNFRNPLLRALAVTIPASFGLQTAFAIPSIIAHSEKIYDVSGSLTFLAVTGLSLYLPSLRAKYASSGPASNVALPSLISAFTAPNGVTGFNWRQVILSGAVAIWATRCTLPSLTKQIHSKEGNIYVENGRESRL